MSIASDCFDYSIRAEKVIWLACQSDRYTDELEDFFQDEEPENLDKICGVKFPRELLEDDSREVGEIMTFLYDKKKLGILVQVATPIPQVFHKGMDGYTHYGFGMYTTQWMYTETLDESFIQRVMEWKKEYVAKCRKKHAAKKAKGEAV